VVALRDERIDVVSSTGSRRSKNPPGLSFSTDASAGFRNAVLSLLLGYTEVMDEPMLGADPQHRDTGLDRARATDPLDHRSVAGDAATAIDGIEPDVGASIGLEEGGDSRSREPGW
jgi:hypothetical protein